jgi:hypothetical protein
VTVDIQYAAKGEKRHHPSDEQKHAVLPNSVDRKSNRWPDDQKARSKYEAAQREKTRAIATGDEAMLFVTQRGRE